jgi:TetR/AcrR family transcriptional regulator, cholesterol catabolism regulator
LLEASSSKLPVGGRRERKKLEVRDRIRSAAVELFRERGYAATTVEEIAERADVAKGTFFNHFPRKDALVAAVAEEMMDRIQEVLGPEEEWEGSGRDQIVRYFRTLASYVERDPEMTKEMMMENLRIYWLRSEPNPGEEAFDRVTLGVLQRAAERGEVTDLERLPMGARLLSAAYITTVVDWLKSGVPVERFREDLVAKIDIIFRGLAAGDGHHNGRGV